MELTSVQSNDFSIKSKLQKEIKFKATNYFELESWTPYCAHNQPHMEVKVHGFSKQNTQQNCIGEVKNNQRRQLQN